MSLSFLILVFASAGKTILNESPSVEAKLKQTCEMLNLAPHSVASQNRSHSRTLYTAADIEAHVGTDGKSMLAVHHIVACNVPRVMSIEFENLTVPFICRTKLFA